MTAYYNEFDPGAAAWLRELIKRGLIADGEVDTRSILDVEPEDLRGFTQCHFFAGIGGWSYALRLAGWPDDRPVWTGSPPCQPFSAAGAQKGKEDERHLAPHFISLVGACRPAVLFGEQVASSAVFGKAASGSRKTAARAPEWAWLDDLQDRLEAARYAVGESDIPAAGVGAPHIRQRTFFGAIRLADANGWVGDAENFCSGERTEDRGLGGAQCSINSKAWQRNGEAFGVTGRDGRLADADEGWLEHASGDGRLERRAEPSGRCAVRGCGGERLADADSGSKGMVRECRNGVGEWKAGNTRFGHWRRGSNDGLANANDTRPLPGAQRGVYRGEEGARAWDGEPQRPDAASGLADAEREQREERLSRPGQGNCPQGRGSSVEPARLCGFGRTGTPDSPWRDADWLFCRDGKWRPVEPGTFPLAHGLPARVGRLRGYGNAIVPQAAAVFIRAFDEAQRAVDLRLMSVLKGDIFE